MYKITKEHRRKMIESIRKRKLGKTYEEIHGIKKAQIIKRKMVNTRRKNGTYNSSIGTFEKGRIPHNKGKNRFDYEPSRRTGNRINHKKGNNHWNWKGGISSQIDAFRQSKEFKKWKACVFIRDNRTCQSCGYVGDNIEAHHLESFSKCEEKRIDVNNGQTLCHNCHVYLHKLFGFN